MADILKPSTGMIKPAGKKQELNDTLRQYLDEVTDRVVAEGVYADSSEAEVVCESQKQLSGM